jgi:hypothetical protein
MSYEQFYRCGNRSNTPDAAFFEVDQHADVLARLCMPSTH